ncbi:DNA/RNA non-specific endonuclease [Carboxylicivirga sp. N1Y90]|uniref:DNA/RNA non-specific endonuclease n=1 Tax=Carboxylicivirga fragile TaxID=3417571 RepID=UPI003D348CDB|nr:DNA/RNA non-specific endonuclease [Marinilabiliaceae bacterium N1Y90]
MSRTITFFLFFSLAIPFWAQYQPSSSGEVIEHTYFSLSFIEDHEQAEWVYYKLTHELVNGSQSRTDNFRPDPGISTGSATLEDYKGSGYDRGHLCPAGDMKINKTAMSETFYMSNMSPQAPSFNRGIWKKLEATVRNWAIIEDSIHIATAGVLSSNNSHISSNEVSVPEYYYKVIYAPKAQKMIAFILPNQKSNVPLHSFIVSVNEVEALTGIDFFPQLPDSLENKLEAHSNTSLWSFKQYSPSPSNTSNSSSAVQCLGIAKSTGNRCKKKTTNANGYCNAHKNQAHNQ